MWQQRLQKVYSSKEEFICYCRIYNNHSRLGFDSPEEAWDADPLVEGSIIPEDYRIVSFRSER